MWILFQLKHQKKVNNVILASQWEFSIKLHFFSTSIEKGFLVTWPVNSQKKNRIHTDSNFKFPQIPMKFHKISFRPFTEYNMLLLNSNIYFCYLFLNPEQRLPIENHFHHQRRIQNTVKHLGWWSVRKQSKALAILIFLTVFKKSRYILGLEVCNVTISNYNVL